MSQSYSLTDYRELLEALRNAGFSIHNAANSQSYLLVQASRRDVFRFILRYVFVIASENFSFRDLYAARISADNYKGQIIFVRTGAFLQGVPFHEEVIPYQDFLTRISSR